MKKWEYMVMSHSTTGSKLEEELDELGAKGWELVSAIPDVTGDNGETRTWDASFVFKREAQ